ncbi:Hypothetical predicted protein [Olea europaea subsp. europaea]|uniref:Uncharacterized protein n=1 Tax=Olea europaea subsp. europaea TaxID=158383 RepID=A0A8S0V2T7_OLEEU|nr:Hypothetical predicted protein [Olea europaea subsp. europaea]
MRTDSRNLITAHASERSQRLHKESISRFRKSSESISPRMQQKKLELEKRPNYPNSPHKDDYLSEGGSNLGNLNIQRNEISVQSSRDIILGSKNVEATSFDESSFKIMMSAEFLMSGVVEKVCVF